MKAYFYSLKQVFKASPFLVIAHIFCTILPSAVLSGLLLSAQRNMFNGVQNYIAGNIVLSALVCLVVIYCVNRLISTFFSILSPYILDRLNQKITFYIQKDINQKYLKVKYELYEQEKTLDIFENINMVTNQIQMSYTQSVEFVSLVAKIVSTLVVMVAVSWQFALIAIGGGVIASLFNLYSTIADAKLYGKQSKERRLLCAYQDLFCQNLQRTMPELKTFNTQEKMVDYSYKNLSAVQKRCTDKHKKMIVANSIAVVIPTLVLILYVVYLLVAIIKNNSTIALGDISVGITGFSSISTAFSHTLIRIYRIKSNSIYLGYYFRFKNLEEEKEGGVDVVSTKPIVKIENVCFSYPGTAKQVLNNVSFDIVLGEHIAFVGENGSGKSTIIKLILGLYAPTSGRISVNGVDIQDYTIAARQKLFGVQYQDFYEFSLPVRDVVAVGNIDIRNQDTSIYRVLRQANIQDTLKLKNATLDTMVGKEWADNAIEFSGGEKQRMSLATTLAYNHKHLILDEPTAALDAVAENRMYEVFMSGIKNKGSLIVSHRLASSRIADRIIVFQNGSVVQDGNFESLMKDKKGLYYKMFTAQSKLYKELKNEEQV